MNVASKCQGASLLDLELVDGWCAYPPLYRTASIDASVRMFVSYHRPEAKCGRRNRFSQLILLLCTSR